MQQLKKAGDSWMQYIQQFEQLKIYFESLPSAIGPWLAQQIDIFAKAYPVHPAGSAVWMKEADFEVKNEMIYCTRAISKGFGYIYHSLFIDINGRRWIDGQINTTLELEILDESNEQPVEQKETKNEFVDIVDNCLREGKVVLDELKKHNALREQEKNEVVGKFLEWVYENSITRHSNGHWYKWDNGQAKEVYYANDHQHILDIYQKQNNEPYSTEIILP